MGSRAGFLREYNLFFQRFLNLAPLLNQLDATSKLMYRHKSSCTVYTRPSLINNDLFAVENLRIFRLALSLHALTMCSTAARIWAYSGRASFSVRRPSFEIFVNSSPPVAYSMMMCSLASVSITSYRRMMFGWCRHSMLEISRDSRRCVFWSSFVLSRIFMATFSVE